MSVALWQRIHIIGIPGSGKSTLARECAATFGLPSFDLDGLLVDDPSSAELQGPERYEASRAAAARLAHDARWVTDGIYCGWTEPLLERAELIIWLDTPALICVWRIIIRHARRSLARVNNFPGLRLLARFAWGVLRDSSKPAASLQQLQSDMNNNSRATTAVHLLPWQTKVLRCRTRRDRARLLESMGRVPH